jgi:hypothetical protein
MAKTIAIVGSVDARRPELDLTDVAAAPDACEALGRALAEAGCDIVVYSSARDFVEADVVRGYVASGKARPGSIQVRYPDGGDGDFPEMEHRPDVFHVRPDVSRAWEVSFYRSLFDADGVLLIGGGQSTLVAGLIAISARTPMVTIAAFGGKAREAWDVLARARNDTVDGELELMGRRWRPGAESALVESLLEQGRRRAAQDAATARHRRTIIAVAFAALAATVVGIVLVFETALGGTVSLFAMLVSPLLAGVGGAILRTILDDGSEWLTATLLGLGAGLIASLLFVASQLATSPDALETSGVKTLVVFAVVVGFIAGFTFDAVFAKVRSQQILDTSAIDR